MPSLTRYFDQNGTNGGFGTLTGAWNATGPTIGWNANAFGTGTVAGITFDATDTAQFGSSSVAAQAGGSVTFPVNATVGTIRTQNLTSTQTITANGGTLVMGANTPTFNMQGGELVFYPPITGTAGFTYSGSSFLRLYSNTSGLSGTVTHTAGANLLIIGPQTNNAQVLNSAFGNTISVGAGSATLFYQQPGVTAFTVNANLTGNQVNQQNDTTTFFTVTINGTMSGLSKYRLYGCGATVGKDLPTTLEFDPFNSGGASVQFDLNLPAGASTTSFSTPLNLISEFGGAIGYFNSVGATAVTITGGIQHVSDAFAFAFKLGGANTGDNTISGNASVTTGIVSLEKRDAGKWILSGDNSPITGGLTISTGTLRGNNANALGGGTVTMSGTPTLELSGGFTYANSITTSGTVRNASGDNTLSGSSITIGTLTTIDSASGTLTVSGAIGGTAALTFGTASTGVGTVVLSNSANSFSANPTIAAGTVQVASLVNSGSNSPLGSGTGVTFTGTSTLKVSGGTSLASTNRALTLTSATATLDSSNALSYFPVVLSGAATASGTTSLTLAGSNTGYNLAQGLLNLGSSDTLAKSGAGRWILTAANAFDASTTGTFSAGTIMAANNTGATGSKLLGGNVTVAAGAKIQLGSDGTQKGCNTYTSLTFNGTLGNPARIRIGGSAVSPTVYLSGDLTLPASGTANWDLTADVFKTPGTYTLFVFAAGKGLSGSGTVTSNVNATYPTGRSGVLAYNEPVGGPKTITVTIS